MKLRFVLLSVVFSIQTFASASIYGSHTFWFEDDSGAQSNIAFYTNQYTSGHLWLPFIWYRRFERSVKVEWSGVSFTQSHQCDDYNRPSIVFTASYVFPRDYDNRCQYQGNVHICFEKNDIQSIVIDRNLTSTTEGCLAKKDLYRMGYEHLNYWAEQYKNPKSDTYAKYRHMP